MTDLPPAKHARRHVIESVAAYARALAQQPPLPPDAPPEAMEYRAAWVASCEGLAEWLYERSEK